MPSPKMDIVGKITKILENATADDLDAFDREIARSEARTRALRAAREVVAEEVLNRPAARQGVRQVEAKVRVAAQAVPKAGGGAPVGLLGDGGAQSSGGGLLAGDASLDALTDEVGRWMFLQGPCMRRKVTSRFGISDDKAQRILDQTDVFEKSGSMYKLTADARAIYDPKRTVAPEKAPPPDEEE